MGDEIVFFLLGLFSGAFGALFGVGGGVILVPALSLIAGMQFRDAVGTSLVGVVAMSVAGSIVFLSRRLVIVGTGLEFQFFSVSGAIIAGLLAPLVPEGPLFFLFGGLLLFTATQMWPRSGRVEPVDVNPEQTGSRSFGNSAAFGSGVMSGLLGVGGGILNTPVLHLAFGLPFRNAAATSIFVIGATASAAAGVYLIRGTVILGISALTMVGAMLGSGSIALIGHRVNPKSLKVGFAVLLTIVAVQMIRRGIAAI